MAYLHDPAVKALVLMRGESHVTIAEAVIQQLFGDRLTRTYRRASGMNAVVETADHWAAAADRPSLPMNLPGKVVFATDPQVIHPLTGRPFRLTELASDAHLEAVKALNLAHFEPLIVEGQDGDVDWRRTFFKFWRFGPETPAQDLGVLWNLLPADTRSPDHSIWEHLKLTSAFAGATAAQPGGPALLLMSFDPVQGFISQARSVSDLWAGSHLLSRIAWEGMRIVCERFGPDAVLFPDLHGVAVADLWLNERLGEWQDGVSRPWTEKDDDTNPLFAAALPNRFVALVPAGRAQTLAREVEAAVRTWARTEARMALAELLAAGDRHQAAAALSEAVHACAAAGLDPLIGFYHELDYGRESLASDLLEPLRPLVDRWVWDLFRRRVLRAEDFTRDGAACLLGKAGRGHFYAEYEAFVSPLRRLLRRLTYRVVRALTSEAP